MAAYFFLAVPFNAALKNAQVGDATEIIMSTWGELETCFLENGCVKIQ